jgi:hypothetical protein
MNIVNEELLAKVGVGVATFLVGAIVTHLWMRFRSRLTILSWTTTSSRVAFSRNDPRYGNLEVHYNGTLVESVFWQAVELVNESTTDLSDLQIVVGFQPASIILTSEGAVSTSLLALPFEEKFLADWNRLVDSKASNDRISFYWEHRRFRIPVLNRQAVARFAFLITPPIGADPILSVSCDHKGVVLRNRPPRDEILGVDRKSATWIGLVLSLAASVIVLRSMEPPWLAVLLSWFLGIFGILWGVMVIRLWRFLVKLMS